MKRCESCALHGPSRPSGHFAGALRARSRCVDRAGNWQLQSREFTGVIYAHQLSITIGQAIRDLELLAHVFEAEELYNRIEFLPL